MGTHTETYRQFQDRERKAREIVATGGVHRSGRAGRYEVESQNGGGRYEVNVFAGTCTCADHEYRGAYCKHLRAAETVHAQSTEPEAPAPREERIVLEVRGYARGRQFVEKKLARVRINGESYRDAKTNDFDRALQWLSSHGYEFDQVVGPETHMGTGTARYFYRREVS